MDKTFFGYYYHVYAYGTYYNTLKNASSYIVQMTNIMTILFCTRLVIDVFLILPLQM